MLIFELDITHALCYFLLEDQSNNNLWKSLILFVVHSFYSTLLIITGVDNFFKIHLYIIGFFSLKQYFMFLYYCG
jgi:hypothetical protein